MKFGGGSLHAGYLFLVWLLWMRRCHAVAFPAQGKWRRAPSSSLVPSKETHGNLHLCDRDPTVKVAWSWPRGSNVMGKWGRKEGERNCTTAASVPHAHVLCKWAIKGLLDESVTMPGGLSRLGQSPKERETFQGGCSVYWQPGPPTRRAGASGSPRLALGHLSHCPLPSPLLWEASAKSDKWLGASCPYRGGRGRRATVVRKIPLSNLGPLQIQGSPRVSGGVSRP